MMTEKSKAGHETRMELKRRTRKYRRRSVCSFYALMLLGLLLIAGGVYRSARIAFIVVCALSTFWWPEMGWSFTRRLTVTGLDDRAQVRHGVNFDRLSGEEQKAILRQRHQLFRLVVDSVQDERQRALKAQAKEKAFEFLRAALPWFLAAYWSVYWFVPRGGLKNALMNGPVWISWLSVFILTLPRVIEKWTEPDEVNEPRVV